MEIVLKGMSGRLDLDSSDALGLGKYRMLTDNAFVSAGGKK